MKMIYLILAFLYFVVPVHATTYNYAPTAQGAGDGTTCGNAYAYNDMTNGATIKATAGNAVNICSGTYPNSANTTWSTFSNNGTSGSHITINLMSGALLQSPYFTINGGLVISGNYTDLVGPGVIENTLNGTSGGACIGGACTHQQDSVLVYVTGTNDTVTNISALNAYVHTEDVDDGNGGGTTGIDLEGANDIATLDTVTNARTGISVGASGDTISFDTISLCDHCAVVANVNNVTLTGISVHNNNIFNTANWDTPSNFWHHNLIMEFTGAGNTTISGTMIYNNYMHGLNGNDVAYLPGTHISTWYFETARRPASVIRLNSLITS